MLTFSFLNAENERFWAKFHFKTQQGHRHYANVESAAVMGRTRESYQGTLFDAIEWGTYPRRDLKVQIMPETNAKRTPSNPFDLTKVWRHAEPPLCISGNAGRYAHRVGNDDYMQADALFRLFDAGQRLCTNIVAAMQGLPRDIIDRQLAHFDKAGPAYGAGVRGALGGASANVQSQGVKFRRRTG